MLGEEKKHNYITYYYQRLIASICAYICLSLKCFILFPSFAKQEEILPTLSSVHWDLVIVDEAHKMAAYRYGNKVSVFV